MTVYTLRLTADGRTVTRRVTVRQDPRSPAPAAAVRAQHDLEMRIGEALASTVEGRRQALALRALVAQAAGPNAAADVAAAASAFGARLDSVAGTLDEGRARGRPRGTPPPDFVALNAAFAAQLNAQDLGDAAPTAGALAAYQRSCTELRGVLAAWARVSTEALPALNAALGARRIAPVRAAAAEVRAPSC